MLSKYNDPMTEMKTNRSGQSRDRGDRRRDICRTMKQPGSGCPAHRLEVFSLLNGFSMFFKIIVTSFSLTNKIVHDNKMIGKTIKKGCRLIF